MRKIVCLLLVLGTLALYLTACTEKLPDSLSGTYTYTSRVKGISANEVVCWDNYILTESKSCVYDRTTGEITYGGFCEDPECDGYCFLEKGKMTFVDVSNGRAYFNVIYGKEIIYGYRDLISGDAKVLTTISFEEMLPNRPTYLDGEWLYYARKMLREGGNPDVAEDYTAHLCRIHKDGGKEEVAYRLRGDSETMLAIADGVMFSYFESKIWRVDMERGEPMMLHDMTSSEIDAIGSLKYLDGFLYFFGGAGVVRMDAQNGQWTYLLDADTANFVITNDAVYYSKSSTWQVNDPVKYPLDSEEAVVLHVEPTLYICDLNGENSRVAWTDPSRSMSFNRGYTVIDGVYYGWITQFDFESNQFGETFFTEIHFDTGEIIPATVVE